MPCMGCRWDERMAGPHPLTKLPCCLPRLWTRKILATPTFRPTAKRAPTGEIRSSISSPGDMGDYRKCTPLPKCRLCSHGRRTTYPWDIPWHLKCAPWDRTDRTSQLVRPVPQFRQPLPTKGTYFWHNGLSWVESNTHLTRCCRPCSQSTRKQPFCLPHSQ